MSAAREWFSAGELAELGLPGLPGTKPGVLQLVRREGWMGAEGKTRKRQGRGGGVEFHVSLLPEAAQTRIAAAAAPKAERLDRESAWLRFDRLPASYKAKAEERLSVLEQIEDLQRHGLNKTRAIEQVVMAAAREARAAGQEPPLKVATIYTWFARIEGVARPDRAAYLAPEYTGRTVGEECSPGAWEYYKSDYLSLSKPPHAGCYERLKRVAPDNGWTIPSAKTLIRRIGAEIPVPVQVLLREGEEAASFTMPARTRDRSGLLPMQILNLDGHTWDVFVRWPNGTISRPHALVVQDIASGKILAIRHDLTLNHHLVRLALGDTFRDHGLCETILMDNGRENAAQAISGGQYRMRWGRTPEQEPAGLLKTLGIKAVAVTPYLGRAKPIERAFRNFAHDVAKGPDFVGAYTGHNTTAKPENYGSKAIPFEQFEAIVRREIAFYNAREGRRGIGMNGRSFDQVFAEGMALQHRPRLTEGQLRLCMLASKPVSMEAGSGAVTVEGHRYWSPELSAVRRQKVTVYFDPERMDLPAYVHSLDGRQLAKVERVLAGTFDSHTDAREARKAMREYKRGLKLQANALKTLEGQDVAARLLGPAPPTPPMPVPEKVVAANFQAPRTPEQLGGAKPDPDFNAKWLAGVSRLAGGG